MENEKRDSDETIVSRKRTAYIGTDDEEINDDMRERDTVKDDKDNVWDFFTNLSLADVGLGNDGKEAPKSWKLSDRVKEHFANTYGVAFKSDSMQKM